MRVLRCFVCMIDLRTEIRNDHQRWRQQSGGRSWTRSGAQKSCKREFVGFEFVILAAKVRRSWIYILSDIATRYPDVAHAASGKSGYSGIAISGGGGTVHGRWWGRVAGPWGRRGGDAWTCIVFDSTGDGVGCLTQRLKSREQKPKHERVGVQVRVFQNLCFAFLF